MMCVCVCADKEREREQETDFFISSDHAYIPGINTTYARALTLVGVGVHGRTSE